MVTAKHGRFKNDYLISSGYCDPRNGRFRVNLLMAGLDVDNFTGSVAGLWRGFAEDHPFGRPAVTGRNNAMLFGLLAHRIRRWQS